MKSAIIDASMMMAVLIPDEEAGSDLEDLIVSNGLRLLVPPVFEPELLNCLLTAYRRRRIDWEKCVFLCKLYQRIAVVKMEVEPDGVMQLAEEKGLTIYDASYVWLARKMKTELLTLDKRMLAAV